MKICGAARKATHHACHQMLRVVGLAALFDRRGPNGERFASITYRAGAEISLSRRDEACFG